VAEGAAGVAAIDLGASSGRVVVGHRTVRGFSLCEVHRFPNRAATVGGVLRSLVRQGVRLTRYLPEGPEQAWERADEIVLSSRSAS
jgi:hypothetical protein